YTIIAIAFMFLGSLLSNDLVWELTDMFNQLMVVPNVLALFALSGMVISECRDAAENQDKEIRHTHHRAR
ncbi:MAG: alanine:cation symporter family protein, partial [Firmicutes bacterium]|nr:alanine:cation symporter family protein [Bacillota bacterium]